MPAMLLLPAASLMIVVLATTWSLRNLGVELTRLRRSLRRAGATSVALAELDRETVATIERAGVIRSEAVGGLHRPRPRPKPLAR